MVIVIVQKQQTTGGFEPKADLKKSGFVTSHLYTRFNNDLTSGRVISIKKPYNKGLVPTQSQSSNSQATTYSYELVEILQLSRSTTGTYCGTRTRPFQRFGGIAMAVKMQDIILIGMISPIIKG